MNGITDDEAKALGAVLKAIRIARGQVTGEQRQMIALQVSAEEITIDSFGMHQKRGKISRGLTSQNGNG